ncbi:hypothetical protein DYB36_003049 [Aphanomyces astaci]|uniref:Guanylate cyclase domain-containing protein n=1 Tax=Aphanomyces astaci TaxID=112090 RepID=A0A397AME9_APHAT|nr:hypothetical protein DYB36_003049 [Aphanomyces astaci]
MAEPPVGRALFINDAAATASAMTGLGKEYAGNAVRTSKYTLVTFLPKTLLEQFRRVANFYFLVISLLQLGTPYSPTNKYSTIVPLILVLFGTEAVEDKARHDADRTVNQSKAEVFDVDAQAWMEMLWKDVRVGGIELDAGLFPLELAGEITCEQPNRRLYTFAGALKIKTPSKFSRLDAIANRCIMLIFTVLFLVCCASTAMSIVTTQRHGNRIAHMAHVADINDDPEASFLSSFLTYLILYNNLVRQSTDPQVLAAVVSNEFQCIQVDPVTGRSVQARTSNLNEDVGQIKYLFSDKTGSTDPNHSGADSTLLSATNNYLMQKSTEFMSRHVQYFASLGLRTLVFGYKRVSFVEFTTWFVAYCKAKTSLVRRGTKLRECARSMETNLTILGATGVEDQLQEGVADCIEALSEAGINIWMLTGDKDETAVSVGTASGLISDHSHLVVINETSKRGCLEQIATARRKLKKIGMYEPFRMLYKRLRTTGLWRQGVASRDVSLVINGEALDSLLSVEDPSSASVSRVSNILSSNHDRVLSNAATANTTMALSPVASGEYSRKRLEKRSPSAMSTEWMGQRPSGGMLRHSTEASFTSLLQSRRQLANKMTPEVASTKLMQVEPLDHRSSEVESSSASPGDSNRATSNVLSFWRSMLMASNKSFGDLPRTTKPNLGDASKVPFPSKGGVATSQSLATLHPPQWKARAVALSSTLGSMAELPASPSLVQLCRENLAEQRRRSSTSMATWFGGQVNAVGRMAKNLVSKGTLSPVATSSATPPLPLAVTSEIRSLLVPTSLAALHRSMSHLSLQLNAAIRSSTTAKHAARVPRSNDDDDEFPVLRLKHLDSDLAVIMFLQLVTQCRSVIACRLSPIQKAQIVALIKSRCQYKLGMQAVRSADFAIGQFRFLSRLILVHGRWNYRRVSIVILFSFYKNMALIMTLFAYSFLNGHSGQTLYESYLMVGWNALYTFFPILVLGIKDEDISAETVLRFPFIYRSNQLDKELNIEKMRLWVGNALLHSFLVFILSTFLIYKLDTYSIPNASLFVYGTAVYGILVVTVCVKAAMIMQHMHRWTRWHYLSIVSGPVLYAIFVASYSEAYDVLHMGAFSDFFGLGGVLFSSITFWLGVVVVSFSSLLLDFIVMYLYRMYLPTNQVIIEEIDCRLERRPSMSTRLRNGASSAASFLFLGDWHKQLHKSTHFTEHEELCWQLAKFEREISRETNEMQQQQQSDDKEMGFIVTSMPPIHPITMEFMGEDFEPLEAEYNRSFAERQVLRVRVLVIIVLVFIPPYAVAEYVFEQDTEMYPSRILMFCCVLGYLLYVRTERFLTTYHSSVAIPLALAGLVLTQSIKYTGKFSVTMFSIVAFSVVRVKFVYALWLVLFNFAYFMLSSEMGLTSVEPSSDSTVDERVVFTIFMAYLAVFAAYDNYQLQITMKLEFVQLRILKYEEHRSRDMLKNMLPSHIVKRLENGATLVSDEEKDVALLFCDVGDSASLTKRYNPREVPSRRYMQLLLCAKHGVRKMETVGKIYLACAGLRGSAKGKEAVLRVAATARDMAAVMGKCRTRNGHTINLRIGIHCGRVISGLVGMKKQQFSLFGDTEAYELLEHDFEFEHRTVEAKGKGTLATHLMGKPMTALAQRACRGRLGTKSAKKTNDSRRLSLTQELQKSLAETWGSFAVSKWTWQSWPCFRSVKVNVKPISSLQSVQEEYVAAQINSNVLAFNDFITEASYLRAKWSERHEGYFQVMSSPRKTHASLSAPNFTLYVVVYFVATVLLVVPNISNTYSHIGLDVVFVVFLASTGGSIMHRHTVLVGVYQHPTNAEGEKLRIYPLMLSYCVGVSNVMSRRDVEYYCRRRYLLYTRTGKEAKKADRLLYKMLPSSVVGILFSDIKGFTSIAAKAETDQVVQILASLFIAFDKLTTQHGLHILMFF